MTILKATTFPVTVRNGRLNNGNPISSCFGHSDCQLSWSHSAGDLGTNKIFMWKALTIILLFVSSISSATSGLTEATQKALDKAEALYGSPIFVTSAHRSPEWNAKVGGVPGSYHLSGEAVDIRMPANNIQLAKLVWAMSRAGFVGCGLYQTHLHFDLRKHETFWRG